MYCSCLLQGVDEYVRFFFLRALKKLLKEKSLKGNENKMLLFKKKVVDLLIGLFIIM